ncbi:MAG: lamin tail domain-containing protein [Myxococcota bacterium]
MDRVIWKRLSVLKTLCAMFLFACGGGENPNRTRTSCSLLQGDLVISEVMADPDGDAPEWVEIYNASSDTQELSGLDVVVTGGGSPRSFSLNVDASLESRGYFVVGGQGSGDFDYVDYATGLQLANSGAIIELNCADTVIDQVAYGSRGALPGPTGGASLSFDGNQAPSAVGNDDATNWCDAGETYDSVNIGTPGFANVACGGGATVSCNDLGTPRDTVPPEVGNLVITEVLANPDGADSARTSEWIEVYNASDTAVDLNGLRIVSSTASGSREFTVDDTECVSIFPGSYAVIGASSDTAVNGAVRVDAVATDLEMYNSAMSLELFVGNALIDGAQVPGATEGVSTFVATLTADGNDSADSFCTATMTGMFNGVGSPGVAGGSCDDGGGGNNGGGNEPQCEGAGGARDIVSPRVGEIAIAEVHSNPSGSDGGKEYIELLLSAGMDLDLNDLVIVARSNTSGNERSFAVDLTACQSFADGRVVIGSTDPEATPTDPAPLDVDVRGDDSIFYNSAQEVRVELSDGTVLDTAQIPAPGNGVAVRASSEPLTNTSNDLVTDWCLEGTTGEFEDTGSPGSPGVCAL